MINPMARRLILRSAVSTAIGIAVAILTSCGDSSKPAPVPTPPPATPSAVGQVTPVPGPNVEGRPIRQPTPAVKFGTVDVLFMPLNDETREGYFLTWEIRHYARATITALIAPFVRCTIGDDFSVEQRIWATDLDLKKPIPLATLRDFANAFGARYVVHTSMRRTEDEAIAASISIIDAQNGRQVGAVSNRGKPGDFSPTEAQRVLLETARAGADLLIKTLGGDGSIPQSGRPTATGARALIAEAETLCRRWDLASIYRALYLSSVAIRAEPADGRAWALAGRCYARLANDTARYPARFHREARLRAIVAVDLARRLAPDDPGVRFGAATALHANRRLVEAETIYETLVGEPEYKNESLIALSEIRRKPELLDQIETKEQPKTGTDAVRYLLANAQLAAGNTTASMNTLRGLQKDDSQNTVLSARLVETLRSWGGPPAYFHGGAQHSVLTVSEAFRELLPLVWNFDFTGRQIAQKALSDLRQIAGDSVPLALDTKEDVANLATGLTAVHDPSLNQAAMASISQVPPDNLLFRLLRTYSTLQSETVKHLLEHPPKTTTPMDFSLLDRVRLRDRLIGEALGDMLMALQNWGVYDAAERFAAEIGKTLPTDVAVQTFAGLFYERGTRYFNPPLVTQYLDQAKYNWAYYLPERLTRARWAFSLVPPDEVERILRDISYYDIFDPDLAATIAERFSQIGRWGPAADFLGRAIKGDPYRMNLHKQLIYFERARSGRQISKESIENLEERFRDRSEIENVVAELYYAAGLTAEAEKACRNLLLKDPHAHSAFFNLRDLLRWQGRHEEADQLTARFVADHPSLTGNAALVDAASFYYERREYDKAARFLEGKWGALDPWQGDTILTMGNLKWAYGDLKGARAEYERSYQRYGRPWGPSNIARIEALRGNWEEMLKQGDRILSRHAATLEGHWLRAIYFLHKGNLAEGEKAVLYDRIMLAHDPRAFRNFGLWRFYAGKFEQAIAICEEGRRYEREPVNESLDLTECRARLVMGDVDGAEPIIQRMKLFGHTSKWTYYCEALWRLRRNETAAARAAIDVARRDNPRDTFIQLAHARILLAEGKNEEAVREMRDAAAHIHYPWHSTEVYLYLAQALEAAGRPIQAKQEYERLLALWPAGYWADQARAGLAK